MIHVSTTKRFSSSCHPLLSFLSTPFIHFSHDIFSHHLISSLTCSFSSFCSSNLSLPFLLIFRHFFLFHFVFKQFLFPHLWLFVSLFIHHSPYWFHLFLSLVFYPSALSTSLSHPSLYLLSCWFYLYLFYVRSFIPYVFSCGDSGSGGRSSSCYWWAVGLNLYSACQSLLPLAGYFNHISDCTQA